MDYVPFLPTAVIVIGLVYLVTKASITEPSEDVMMQRLIQIRLGRKMAKITRDDLEKEIEASAERLAAKVDVIYGSN